MTQEENLLIKDLCSRLPYGVMLNIVIENSFFANFNDSLKSIDTTIKVVNDEYDIENVKPYFFPLSLMTEKQKAELASIADCNDISKYGIGIETRDYEYINIPFCKCAEVINYLNQNHFDYNGLIDKGLAIDCTNLNIY